MSPKKGSLGKGNAVSSRRVSVWAGSLERKAVVAADELSTEKHVPAINVRSSTLMKRWRGEAVLVRDAAGRGLGRAGVAVLIVCSFARFSHEAVQREAQSDAVLLFVVDVVHR